MKGLIMGAALLILASLADVRQLPVVEAAVDTLDVNTVYCGEDGHTVLTQVVFLEHCGDGWNVIGWRLYSPAIEPAKVNGRWRVLFVDNGVLRRVWATAVRRTWHHADYEVMHRQAISPEDRRELGKQ